MYVNCRAWPEGYVLHNPLDPPPVACEIDIHVIDLNTFQEVGVMLRDHRLFVPSDECLPRFLDVSDDYIARYFFSRDHTNGVYCKKEHSRTRQIFQ